MTRPQRIEYEGAYYHVVNRGAGHGNIFHDDVDRRNILEIINEAFQRFGLEVHAYCLMDNHYHLLVKTPRGNLSRIMRHINGVYTQRYNRRRKTDGALFRGRYKAILIDSDAYLLHLSKYIHLNPLSANMVSSLEEYRWSSYLAYVGEAIPEDWLCQLEVYGQVSGSSEGVGAYRAFMNNQEISQFVVDFYSKERLLPVLGEDAFISGLKLTQSTEETPRQDRVNHRPVLESIFSAVSDVFDVPVDRLLALKKGRGQKNMPRKVAMYVAQKYGDYRLNEIAKAFGLSHYGGVSSAIHALSEELKTNDNLLREINIIINRLDP